MCIFLKFYLHFAQFAPYILYFAFILDFRIQKRVITRIHLEYILIFCLKQEHSSNSFENRGRELYNTAWFFGSQKNQA